MHFTLAQNYNFFLIICLKKKNKPMIHDFLYASVNVNKNASDHIRRTVSNWDKCLYFYWSLYTQHMYSFSSFSAYKWWRHLCKAFCHLGLDYKPKCKQVAKDWCCCLMFVSTFIFLETQRQYESILRRIQNPIV